MTETRSELIAYVREVAEHFVLQLRNAEADTRNWGDTGKAIPLVGEAMDTCLASLAATSLWGRENQLPASALWNAAGDWLARGEMQHRAYAKPRGYAGDYQLMEQIYENFQCADPLGKVFDLYFQHQDAPQAVRERIDFAGKAIQEHIAARPRGEYCIVSIGSGPAIDVELALRESSPERLHTVHVTLLDLDDESLQAAQQRLSRYLPAEQINLVRENLFRLPERPHDNTRLPPADFIACLGLFDYLSDDGASAMLRCIWSRLNSGGTLLVGNFAPTCTTRAYMEWVAQWYLIYRTREQLRGLIEKAGIPAATCQDIPALPTAAAANPAYHMIAVQKP